LVSGEHVHAPLRRGVCATTRTYGAKEPVMRSSLFMFAATLLLSSIAAGASAQSDGDGDYIPDTMEYALAWNFFPQSNMHCGSYEGTSYGSQGQFYGSNVGYATNGRLPFVAHVFWDSVGPCATFGKCIELRYGMAYNWDLGDDTWGGSHRGDSETLAILIMTDAPWNTAINDVNAWYTWKVYRSAHACGDGDSSTFQTIKLTYAQGFAPSNWVAEGKNGNYKSQSSCNNGGVADADDCSDHRCWINKAAAANRLQNVGEFGDPSTGTFKNFVPLKNPRSGYMGGSSNNRYIPYPGSSPRTAPSGSYDVWSGSKFGSAGNYCKHLTRFLDWTYDDQYCSAHPDCP
jgi:hypothetical protein